MQQTDDELVRCVAWSQTLHDSWQTYSFELGLIDDWRKQLEEVAPIKSRVQYAHDTGDTILLRRHRDMTLNTTYKRRMTPWRQTCVVDADDVMTSRAPADAPRCSPPRTPPPIPPPSSGPWALTKWYIVVNLRDHRAVIVKRTDWWRAPTRRQQYAGALNVLKNDKSSHVWWIDWLHKSKIPNSSTAQHFTNIQRLFCLVTTCI